VRIFYQKIKTLGSAQTRQGNQFPWNPFNFPFFYFLAARENNTKVLSTGLEWNGLMCAKTAAASFNFRPLIANWYKKINYKGSRGTGSPCGFGAEPQGLDLA
jgi:hypothetical protein